MPYHVTLKIQPKLYFHEGHRMSIHRNFDTPPKNWGIFRVVVRAQDAHRVVFTTFFLLGES
jgi:hypothetical protein